MLNIDHVGTIQAALGYLLDEQHASPDPGWLEERTGCTDEQLRAAAYAVAHRTELEPSPDEQPEPRAAFSSYVSAARDLSENLPDSLPMTGDIRTPSDADAVLETFEQHAAALRRERTAPVWVVPAPWDGPTLELEPAPSVLPGGHPDTFEQLGELGLDLSSERDEHELARLMLAAGALFARGCGSLSQCMRTAVIWERG